MSFKSLWRLLKVFSIYGAFLSRAFTLPVLHGGEIARTLRKAKVTNRDKSCNICTMIPYNRGIYRTAVHLENVRMRGM